MAPKKTKITSSTAEKAVDNKVTDTAEKLAKKPVKKSVEEAEAKPTEKPIAKAEVKPVEKSAEKAAPVPKTEAAKKPAAKKTTKPTTKKSAAKKEIKVNTVVEYYGKQVEERDIIASVKKAWTKSGKKVGDIKTMNLYIKPEESAVYYVINGTDTGSVSF